MKKIIITAIPHRNPTVRFTYLLKGIIISPTQRRILRIISEIRGPRLYLLSCHKCWNSTERFFFIIIALRRGAIIRMIPASAITLPFHPSISFVIIGATNCIHVKIRTRLNDVYTPTILSKAFSSLFQVLFCLIVFEPEVYLSRNLLACSGITLSANLTPGSAILII